MLNLERLRVLAAVASHGSISAAADVLHVTTSAVSQQMARLEREVGQPLMERQGRGVRLTGAAELLAGHARTLLAQVETVEAELAERRGAVLGRLSVAAFATAARGLAPGALRLLADRYPNLRVALSEQEPDQAIPRVARGEVDIAIVQDWRNARLPLPEELTAQPLLDDIMDVALPASHPLAGREHVAITELAHESWVSWTAGQICHDWLLTTLRAHGVEPDVVHTAAEHPTQLALVAAGLGAAMIPRLGRDPVPDGICLVGIRPRPIRQVYAVWRTTATRRPAIAAAVQALRECAP